MDSPPDARSVLWVDHDAERSTALARSLLRRGYRVTRTATGREALERMPALEPSVVVAATDLSGTGVLEVCRAAVAIPRPAVVILMAKCLDVSEATRAIGAGACDFVRTPVDSEELLTRIEVHLRATRGRGQEWTSERDTGRPRTNPAPLDGRERSANASAIEKQGNLARPRADDTRRS